MEALIRDKEDRLSSKRYRFKDLTSASPSFASIVTLPSTRPGASTAPKDFSGRYAFPNDAEDIKAHKWFRGIPWDRLHHLEPPFVPRIRSVDDTHYFDEEEEISDWSESRPSEESDDATPTMPYHHPSQPQHVAVPAPNHFATSSPVAGRNHLHTLTPTTPIPTHQQRPTTAHQLREAEANLFLRSMRRSIQRWALAAVTLPYDSTRIQSQLDALPGLDGADRLRLRQFVRLFGRKDRKRPRDRLLRDRATRAVALDVRRRTAFMGYTWRRMRPVDDDDAVGMGDAAARERGGTTAAVGVAGGENAGGGNGGGVDGMFEREGSRHGFAGGYGYDAAGGNGGGDFDYGYGRDWDARAGHGPSWGNVSAVGARHGKGRFSWR
jgi:hypothetical protein